MNNEMNDKIQKFCEAWADVDVSGIDRMRARSRKQRQQKKQRKYMRRKQRQLRCLAIGVSANKSIQKMIENA